MENTLIALVRVQNEISITPSNLLAKPRIIRRKFLLVYMIIEINGLAIEVIKKAIKNINLRIYPPEGLVKVSAPLHFKEKTIINFLQKHSLWIEAQRKRIQARAPVKEDALKSGSIIFFKGEPYSLILQEHDGPAHVDCKDNTLHCYLPRATSTTQINNLIDRWYKKEMQALLPSLISHWESLIQVHATEWTVKKMKTRWGSCNTRAHRICLNLNLMKKPLICLEYVLVHELVHILEASRNQRFYQYMDQFMPQWREYDYLLEGRKRRM